MAALAAGAVKLASGWAEGGAQLGRLSASLGVTTDDLQKFQAAGERFGVSKEETTGALGSLASNMHEAKYGRNQNFLQMLNQLGLSMRLKADGSADASAEMLDLSDAIAKKTDPQTQARIADLSGLGAALPMLRQGRAAVQAAMDDAAKHAAIRTPDDVAAGTRLYGKGVALSQLGGRAGMVAERGAALMAEPGLDASLSAGRDMADGISSGGAGKAATTVISGAANVFSGAVSAFKGAVVGLEGLVNRHTLGGRLNNLGNIRPVGGSGFRRFARPEDSLLAMGEQIVRDETVHGARTPYDLIAGAMGPDGQRHYGYAPASDHNDSSGYASEIGARSGVGRNGALNPNDPSQLAALMSAMVARETGSKVSADQMLPIAREAIGREQRLIIEFHGVPAGAKVSAKAKPGSAVAVAHASVGSGSI